jgi:hypothetical protein
MTVKIRSLHDALIAPFSGIELGQFAVEMSKSLMCPRGVNARLSVWSANEPIVF